MSAVETLTDHWLGERDDGDYVRYEDHAAVHAALVAQIAELTRERNEARDQRDLLRVGLTTESRVRADAESEVTRLTEALAAAERADVIDGDVYDAAMTRAKAAEARVRELEAQVERQRVTIQAECKASSEHYERATVAEARVRAENKRIGDACQSNYERVEALETLLAASEARAAQWQADAESYRVDATVAQDRLAALKTKVANALEWLAVGDWTPQDNIRKAQEALRG